MIMIITILILIIMNNNSNNNNNYITITIATSTVANIIHPLNYRILKHNERHVRRSQLTAMEYSFNLMVFCLNGCHNWSKYHIWLLFRSTVPYIDRITKNNPVRQGICKTRK